MPGASIDTASLKGWKTVVKLNGADVEHQHYVPGNWPPEGHPLYSDEVLVARVTDWLLRHGRTVFQSFLLYPTSERMHSLSILGRVNAPLDARVLSLGCGVAGMEAYWHDVRRDLRFTLVNASAAQLLRCLCPGDRVLADMQDEAALSSLPDWACYDLVVMGYSLHHVASHEVPAMLKKAFACLRPGGTLLVLDVVEGSQRFSDAVRYEALHSLDLQRAGLVRLDHGLTWHRLPTEVLGEHVAEVLDAGEATPSMWLGMA